MPSIPYSPSASWSRMRAAACAIVLLASSCEREAPRTVSWVEQIHAALQSTGSAELTPDVVLWSSGAQISLVDDVLQLVGEEERIRFRGSGLGCALPATAVPEFLLDDFEAFGLLHTPVQAKSVRIALVPGGLELTLSEVELDFGDIATSADSLVLTLLPQSHSRRP